MTSETRTFTSLGSFNLSYQYNLAGELTSITNPWSVVVGYLHDKIGRVTSVSGAGYAGISSYVSNIAYRAFGAAKQMSYGNGKTLSMQYNNRLFLTQWNIPGLLGYTYHYDNYSEANTGRVTFMDNLTNGAARDGSLDRAYIYDHVGRLALAYTGSEARATIGTDQWGHPDGPYAHGYNYDVWGNRTHREGWGGIYGSYVNDYATYTNNRMDGLTYDAAGNFTASGTASYDATGQQVAYTTGGLTHAFAGDRLRGKRVDNSVTTYYLRSSVLGGQVVAEINASSIWTRGYVYLGGQMLAIQYAGAVSWVHQEPITKGQRFTDSAGNSTGTIVEVDPWGGDTGRSVNSAFQPHLYTSYERDSDVGDDAMNRRYAPYPSRFSQPDPYDGSYAFTNPQSFNRYAYVNNDPVNFVDPSGLDQDPPLPPEPPDDQFETVYIYSWGRLSGSGGGGGIFGNDFFFDLEVGTDSGVADGGGIDPQKTGRTQDNCHRFAAIVDQLAANAASDAAFAQSLNNRFLSRSKQFPYSEFRSTGFKPQFRDETPSRRGANDNSPNQVYHYVGGFVNAYGTAANIATAAMFSGVSGYLAAYESARTGALYYANRHENYDNNGNPLPDSPSHRADRALNGVSILASVDLAFGFLNRRDLGDRIRREVCR